MLSSRVITYPDDFESALAFYDGVLELARYREYGVDGRITGVVYFLGGGFLEVASGHGHAVRGDPPLRLWLQVRDVDAEHDRLAAAGAAVNEPPADMPWGLREMDVEGPDGISLRVVQVPDTHPLRRRV